MTWDNWDTAGGNESFDRAPANDLQATNQQSVASLPDPLEGESLSRLRSALREASLSSGSAVLETKLPWELPGLDLVFNLGRVFPETVPVVPLPMPSLEDVATDADPSKRAKRARVLVESQTCFGGAINFSLVEDDPTLDDVRWQRALEQWMAVVLEDPQTSLIGSKIYGMAGADALKSLRQLFGRKSVATVAKGGGALCRYVSWVQQKFLGVRAVPFQAKHLDEYLDHLEHSGAAWSLFRNLRSHPVCRAWSRWSSSRNVSQLLKASSAPGPVVSCHCRCNAEGSASRVQFCLWML